MATSNDSPSAQIPLNFEEHSAQSEALPSAAANVVHVNFGESRKQRVISEAEAHRASEIAEILEQAKKLGW